MQSPPGFDVWLGRDLGGQHPLEVLRRPRCPFPGTELAGDVVPQPRVKALR